MGTANNNSIKANELNENREVEVLYQRMGSRWYAFSAQGDEVFYSAVPEEVISESNSGNNGNQGANQV